MVAGSPDGCGPAGGVEMKPVLVMVALMIIVMVAQYCDAPLMNATLGG